MANNRVNMAFIIQNHKNCDRHRNFAYATHTRMKVCLAVCMTRLKTHLIQILWVFNCSQIIDYNNNEQLIPLILLLHHDCIVLKHYTKMQDIVYRHPVYTPWLYTIYTLLFSEELHVGKNMHIHVVKVQ